MTAEAGKTESSTVIRIVRKKKGHGGHHGGAWKVAYADFVTAMMAFFLVMWIVGLSKPVREAIEAYFKDPMGTSKKAAGGKGILDGSAAPAVLKDPTLPPPPPPKDDGIATMQAQFKSIQKSLVSKLEKLPEFARLRDGLEIHLTEQGLRIELMEKNASFFFDSASAELKRPTYHLLRVIAQELGHLDNPIVIEGHTDPRAVRRRASYSNWELSADRANAARRVMEASGLKFGQVVEVRGYADRKLLNPKNPLHFSNRRVSILVAYNRKSAGD